MEVVRPVDLITLADAVRGDLRTLLSTWSTKHPTRLVMSVRITDIGSLAHATQEQVFRALAQLSTYVGAPLSATESKTPIPYKYAIHPFPVSGVVEIIVLTTKLEENPGVVLADELFLQAKSQGGALDVDEEFIFTPSPSIIGYMEHLPRPIRERVRPMLNRRLKKAGFTPEFGAPTYSLPIRRTS